MMPRADVVLICDQIIQDAQTGKNSLIGLFDRIFCQSFPAVHPQLFIYTRLRGEPAQQFRPSLRLVGPSGVLLDLKMGEVTLGITGVVELKNQIVGLRLPEPGEYRFLTMINDLEAGETCMRVDQVQPRQPAAPPSESVN